MRIGEGGWLQGPIALGSTAISVVIIIVIIVVGRGITAAPAASIRGKDDVV
ncbi:MAG: hypothetical protein HKN46_11210 [Acidimicrobiia bacterium]|nr:hypothetical protein [Acidimicrobiia bacterium]